MTKLLNTVFLFTALCCSGYASDILRNEELEQNKCLQDTQNDIKEQNNTYYNLLINGLTSIPNLIGNGLYSVSNLTTSSIYSVSNLIKSGWNFLSSYTLRPTTTINDDKNKIVRILSLDGGGTRIYSQAKFLEYFCNDAKIDDLGEYFDIIAASSSGSISAVALANGMNPADLMTFAKEKTPWIFTVRSPRDIFSNNASYPSNKPNLYKKLYLGIFASYPFYKAVSEDSNYGDARLRKELTDIFGDRKLPSLKTSVLLTAYNYSEHNPLVFTNTNIDNIPELFKDIKIVDAVMGAISAPIYFPATKLKLSTDPDDTASSIVDGGLFQYNPSTLAFATAQMLYPSAKQYSILSLGTGETEIGLHFSSNEKEPSDISIIQYSKLYNITLTNAGLANDILFKSMNTNKNSKVSYYRFDFKLDTSRDYELDTSTSEFFDYLDNTVTAKYQEDKEKIKQFINELNN